MVVAVVEPVAVMVVVAVVLAAPQLRWPVPAERSWRETAWIHWPWHCLLASRGTFCSACQDDRRQAGAVAGWHPRARRAEERRGLRPPSSAAKRRCRNSRGILARCTRGRSTQSDEVRRAEERRLQTWRACRGGGGHTQKCLSLGARSRISGHRQNSSKLGSQIQELT